MQPHDSIRIGPASAPFIASKDAPSELFSASPREGRHEGVCGDSGSRIEDVVPDTRATNALGINLRREWVRRFVVKPYWILLQLAAVVIDTATPNTGVRLIVFIVFYFDIALRVYAFGPSGFFRKTLNLADAAIVLLSTVATVLRVSTGKCRGLAQAIVLGRCVLLGFRMVFRSFLVFGRCCTGMRYITGKGKARFVDPVNDIDLDLVYITRRLICMSVPANGWITSLYRNPYSEVVHFFESYHPHHYKIFNACPELPYPASGFVTGSVEHYDVTDHMPPSMEQLLDFIAKAQDFLNRDPLNVVAVHCRGGKGRTGTFIAAWLLYDGEVTPQITDASGACDHFARLRTDLNPRTGATYSHQQGVETPSQRHMVRNFERLVQVQGVRWPLPLAPPPPAPVRLGHLRAVDMFRRRPGAMVVAVKVGGRTIHWSGEQQSALHGEGQAGTWGADWLLDIVVDGDVRISVARKPSAGAPQLEHWDAEHVVAGKEPGCLFYVVINTAFLDRGEVLREGTVGGADKDRAMQSQSFSVSQVDKAFKDKRSYNMNGILEIQFEPLHV